MASNRKARVADAIRDTLSEMIAREVKDPRVTGAGVVVSITRVEMNVDLSVATISISSYGDAAATDKVVEGLRGAAGFLRGPLARRLRLARPPELRFVRDTGLAFALEISNIVRDDEARAKAAREAEAGEGASPPDDEDE